MRQSHSFYLLFNFAYLCRCVWVCSALSLLSMGCDSSDKKSFVINCPANTITNTSFEAEQAFTAESNITNQNTLRLSSIGGNVEINGVSGSSVVSINATKTVQSESLPDAETHLSDLQVEVSESSDEILVRTIQPNCNDGRKYLVHYEISVPDYFAVAINHISGAIAIDSVNGFISVNSINGDLQLSSTQSNVAIDLLTGNVELAITLLPLLGDIDVTLLNGDISLNLPSNTSAILAANVSNGNINTMNLSFVGESSTATSLQGTLGDGQGSISLRIDQSGDINILGA